MTHYKFHVNGMHCKACVVLTETELAEHPQVSSVKSNLHTRSVIIEGNFNGKSEEEVATELSKLLSEHSLSVEKPVRVIPWSEFGLAIPIAFAFVLLFVALQKLGVVNLIGSGNVSYATAFIIGVVASLSTCMAVVGGLLLSLSATFARKGEKFRPQLLFHIGRLISFFVLGGVIGAIGSVFQLGVNSTFILGLIVGVVMLILGINLLDVFHWSKRFQPAMPKFLARRALSVSKLNHTLTPFLVGVVTFFLPCGFTQSMQIYTLSTGNFLSGGLTMLIFALGTLPVLALISFSSFSIRNSAQSGVFFKSAGLIAILFAVFNIINSLVAGGYIAPLWNF